MRIFVLEDDPDRIRQFCQWFGTGYEGPDTPDRGIRWTCIQTNARLYNYEPPYDVMFLDHDLGGRQMIKHDDDGRLFVRDIADTLDPDTHVFIHSHNHDAAKEMFMILSKDHQHHRTLVVPFGSPEFAVVIEGVVKQSTGG